jgi:dihydrofolate reductase
MGKVISEISMSLDGFVTGPNVRVGNGMGDDGDRLHDWRFDAKTETDDAIVDETYASTGAVLIGKRMFDIGFEPWGDPPPFGSRHLGRRERHEAVSEGQVARRDADPPRPHPDRGRHPTLRGSRP